MNILTHLSLTPADPSTSSIRPTPTTSTADDQLRNPSALPSHLPPHAESSTAPLRVARPSLTALQTPPRLRSCLSPSRQASGCATPDCSVSSRTASFSSEASSGGWRRGKSVRWEGDGQGTKEGSAVTSYHATWSALEYDRSPLDPPSQAERDCVLPDRGSRSLRPTVECFPTVHSLLGDSDICDSPVEDTWDPVPMTALPFPHTRLDIEGDVDFEDQDITGSDTELSGDEGHEEEDREWEECMERRRLMFTMRNISLSDDDRQPAFEGYKSLSATLVDLLCSVGCGDSPAGSSSAVDTEAFMEHSPHLLSLQNLEVIEDSPHSLHQRDLVDEGMGIRRNVQHIAATPSLLSSTGSEAESIFASSPTTADGLGLAMSTVQQAVVVHIRETSLPPSPRSDVAPKAQEVGSDRVPMPRVSTLSGNAVGLFGTP